MNRQTESAPRETAGAKRRNAIFTALHDCVIEKGYSATSLADVARAAGMSPSHLLYYFPGKDAILVEYFSEMTRRIFARLDALREQPPEQQVDLLATLFFTGKAISRSENGFMLECFGIAVHNKELRQAKTELDLYCKSYLREFLAKTPCGPANAANAAEVAYALLVGLRTATYFDERLEPQLAYRIFRSQLLQISGLDRQSPKKKGKAKNQVNRKGTVKRRASQLSGRSQA